MKTVYYYKEGSNIETLEKISATTKNMTRRAMP